VDLSNILASDIQNCFKEFADHFGKCKFSGCTHINEPECVIKKMVDEGIIAQSRYESYKVLFEEALSIKRN